MRLPAFGALIGLCVGELLYLLDAWFHVGGGMDQNIIHYTYGMLIVVPFRITYALKPHFLGWNAMLVLYYGINGLVAGGIVQSKVGSKLVKCLCLMGVIALQIALTFIFL